MESATEVLAHSPLIDLCNALSPERKNDKKFWLKIVGFLHRHTLDYKKFDCYEKYNILIIISLTLFMFCFKTHIGSYMQANDLRSTSGR